MSAAMRQRSQQGETGYEIPVDVPKDAIIFNFSKFQQNNRFFLLMIPAMFVLIMFGGKLVLGTAISGLLVVYMLDFNGFQESTLVAIWLSVLACIVELIISAMGLFRVSIFNVALVYNMLLMCMALGLWATLQFQFLQRSAPRLVLILERLLFSVMPATPAVIMTWATVAMYGIENAAYYMLVFLCISNYLFCLPVRSSFCLPRDEREKEDEDLTGNVLGRLETAVHTCGLVLVPFMLHVAINHAHLFKTTVDISNLALLISLPMLYIFLLVPKGSLWWAGFDDSALASVRKVMTCILIFVVVTCIEARVIFHAFSDFIRLPAPYNYLVVTAGVYALTALSIGRYLDLLTEKHQSILIVLAVVAAVALSFAIGLPYWIMFFSVVSAFYFARFYFTVSLIDYVGFVCGSFVVVFWFVHKTFMFLDFEFNALPMSIYHVSLVLMLLYFCTLMIPGLIVSSKNLNLNGGILIVHGFGIMLLEMLTFEQFPGIYPIYLVVLTSVMGIILAFRLERTHRISDITSQLLASVYLAKLGILTHPTPYGVRSALLLTITCAPFSHHYWSHKAHTHIPTPLAYAHVASIFVAALVTRHTLLAAFMQTLLEHTASESSLFALVFLVWSMACFPFASSYFPRQAIAFKRLIAAALGGSCALLFVQPNMEWAGSLMSLNGLPHEASSSPSWPSWCAVAAVVIPLVGVSSNKFRPVFIRVPLCILTGSAAGLFLSGTYIDMPSPAVSVLFCSATSLLAIFISFCLRPSVRSHEFLPFIFAAFVALFPVIFVLDVGGADGHHYSTRLREEHLEQLRVSLLSMYVCFSIFVAVLVKIKTLSSILAAQGKHRPLQARAAVHSALNHSWLPTVGNLATCFAFVLALVLALVYMDGPETSVVFLSPILLLLSSDTGLFRFLSDNNRYFPMVVVTSAFLVLATLFNVFFRASDFGIDNIFSVVKNIALLAIVVPSHALFSKFLWDFKRQSWMMWVALMPLNLVPIFLTDLPTVVALAALALVFSVAQLGIAHQISRHGMQFI